MEMRENLRRGVAFARQIAGLKIGLYAANAGFFLLLSVFPGLVATLGLLRRVPLAAGMELRLQGLLPEPLLMGLRTLAEAAWESSAAELGLSALTALWSASRGIYGLFTGLNAVCGAEEKGSWLRKRLLCVGYTLAFALLLPVTLGLLVFGNTLVELLRRSDAPILRLTVELIDLRFVVLLVLLTGVFAALYLALAPTPRRPGSVLPGALLASCGWVAFSQGYSVYVEHFAPLSRVYGPVYAVALAMLWLYGCMAIVLCGGVLNTLLRRSGKL